ncbi:MAG: hypothetical protein R3E97_16875 [Candidatus Eisenbacteria bacterium]
MSMRDGHGFIGEFAPRPVGRAWVLAGLVAIAAVASHSVAQTSGHGSDPNAEHLAPVGSWPAGFWVVLSREAALTLVPSDIEDAEWPEHLAELGTIVSDLGSPARGWVSRRGVRVEFSGEEKSPEWFQEIAARARAVPGVVDAACLPPTPLPNFIAEEVTLAAGSPIQRPGPSLVHHAGSDRVSHSARAGHGITEGGLG